MFARAIMAAMSYDYPVARYEALRTPEPIAIDGRLDKPAWREAPRSPRFVDLVSGVPGLLDTRMASLWDDEYLYVGFWVSEPNVQARLARRYGAAVLGLCLDERGIPATARERLDIARLHHAVGAAVPLPEWRAA